MSFYFSIFGAVFFYFLGDFLAKMWSLKNENWWLVGSLAIYFLGSLFFVFAVKKSSLSLAVATAPLAIAITGILLGYFYFGERLTNFQYCGIALGLVALTFLLFPFSILQK